MSLFINLIVFICLGILSLVLCVLTVFSKNLLRSATYLFLVLLCTAGFYLFLNYHFLAAVQVSVYVGGVVILFIFTIFLTDTRNIILIKNQYKKYILGILVMFFGIVVTLFVLLKHRFIYVHNYTIDRDKEIDMRLIGKYLIGVGKYQYFFPFEALSLLLLACAIGGILIARKK